MVKISKYQANFYIDFKLEETVKYFLCYEYPEYFKSP